MNLWEVSHLPWEFKSINKYMDGGQYDWIKSQLHLDLDKMSIHQLPFYQPNFDFAAMWFTYPTLPDQIIINPNLETESGGFEDIKSLSDSFLFLEFGQGQPRWFHVSKKRMMCCAMYTKHGHMTSCQMHVF